MVRVRILSLDGGGVRGAYSAAVLASIEKKSSIPLGQCFDLITGTSTGGILAIGLALGLSAADLLEFYKNEAENIFPSSGVFAGWFGAQYDQRRLEEVLEKYFRKRLFGEAITRLVVTAYNASKDNAHLFKTYHHPDLDRHYKLRASEIALATAAAPTFFAAKHLPLGTAGEDNVFLDGGVWANAPTLVGIAEAVRYMGATTSDISMLSIGSGYKPFSIMNKHLKGGKIQWGFESAEFLLGAQQAGSVGTARMFLGDRFVRVQKELEEDVKMDDANAVSKMLKFGEEDGEKEEVLEKILRMFCDSSVEPFTPLKATTS